MNNHAVARKPRKHPAIESSKHAFSEAIRMRNAEIAAKIVFNTAIDMLGVKGLINALDQGNKFWIRKYSRQCSDTEKITDVNKK